jgi:hypothetical protein
MTTSATRQGTVRTIAEREAWEVYRESLRDLHGADYEEAERISWATLQGTLRELSARAAAN